MLFRIVFLVLAGLSPMLAEAQYRVVSTSLTGSTSFSNYSGGIESVETFRMPGQRMMKTGMTLTLCGGALAVGGIILSATSDPLEYDPYTGNYYGDPGRIFGAVMIVAGVGMIIPGVIVWTKGSKKYNRYLEQQNMALMIRGNGLALRYRF